MDTILFLDTCILLDFYRRGGRDQALSGLRHIDENHRRIVTTAQVAMEFSKKRQGVLLGASNSAKSSGGNEWRLPGVLAAKVPQRARAALAKFDRRASEKILAFLSHPARVDPVFRAVHQLTRARTPLNLHRGHKRLLEIEQLAWARFVRGCPPRKDRDLSMGDAINWEWMLACARDTQSHLVIVSRDGDFGTTHANRTFLNDYLADEFKNRVGRKLRLTLTPNLIEGLKAASIKVTKREQRAAKATLDDLTAQSQAFVGLSPGVAMGDYYDAWPPPYLQAVLSQRRHFPFGSLETTDTPLPLKVG